MSRAIIDQGPLAELDEWDDFVATRYKQGKGDEEFRNYRADANPTVTEFYRLNHANQTLEYILKKKAEFTSLTRGEKSIWGMTDYLNTLVDDSDPDTDVSQIEHLLQTSEAIRKDGHPRWFVLTGFVHDLGKVLCLYGEQQWGASATHSRLVARIRIRSSFQNSLPPIQIAACRNIKPSTASIHQTAGSTRCICPGDTTNTFIP